MGLSLLVGKYRLANPETENFFVVILVYENLNLTLDGYVGVELQKQAKCVGILFC